MNVPFDEINGEQIDLTNQSHRDEIIRRNKVLDKAVNDGVELDKIKVTILIDVEFQCVKCGTNIEHRKHNYDIDDFDFSIEDNMPTIKCKGCSTKYCYNDKKSVYDVILVKPKINIKDFKVK
jgi:hypothetical protein